jgi:hypothetical protein
MPRGGDIAASGIQKTTFLRSLSMKSIVVIAAISVLLAGCRQQSDVKATDFCAIHEISWPSDLIVFSSLPAEQPAVHNDLSAPLKPLVPSPNGRVNAELLFRGIGDVCNDNTGASWLENSVELYVQNGELTGTFTYGNYAYGSERSPSNFFATADLRGTVEKNGVIHFHIETVHGPTNFTWPSGLNSEFTVILNQSKLQGKWKLAKYSGTCDFTGTGHLELLAARK